MKSMLYVSICLLLAMAVLLGGCGSAAANELNAVNVEKAEADPKALSDAANNTVADFALRLLNSCEAEGDTLVSPTSILCALAMTANGAEGETLSEMESAIGMSIDELNEYMAAFLAALDNSEGSRLSSACSMWLREDPALKIKEEFLSKNARYYDSSVFTAPFDESTLSDINSWVKKNTGGMVDKILEEIPDAAMLYLINAVAFDAKWQSVYTENQVEPGTFTNAAGEDKNVDFMDSREYFYLDDGKATGFLKYYTGSHYAFAALLPNSGVALEDYIAGLSGEGLRAMLTEPQNTAVIASLPKFDSSCSLELSEALRTLGINELFDPEVAGLSGIGSYADASLYVSRILHKCHVAVDEQGTKAGAVTAAEAAEGAALIEELKYVVLNRPFLYMILDCNTMTPVFIGTLTDIS